MVDLSEFEVVNHYLKRGCKIKHLDLDDIQRAKIEAALASPGITAESISKVLRSWGVSISAPTVARHRRGGCACE